MRAIDRLLPLLEKARPAGDSKWTARCPAHEDKNPSLSLTQRDDRVLIKCFTGCTAEAIVKALNLELGDLFDEARRQQPPMQSQQGRVRIGWDLLEPYYLQHVTAMLRDWDECIRYVAAGYHVTQSELLADHLAGAYRHRDHWREQFAILHEGTEAQKRALFERICL